MANLTNRDGLYYVRFIIPKGRWQGAWFPDGNPKKHPQKDALRLRDAALAASGKQLNRKLIDAGLHTLELRSGAQLIVRLLLLPHFQRLWQLPASQILQTTSESEDVCRLRKFCAIWCEGITCSDLSSVF